MPISHCRLEPDQDNACVGNSSFLPCDLFYRLANFYYEVISVESNRKKELTNKILRLTETAIMIAIATVLNEFSVIRFPFGGTVTVFSQVPIVVLAFRYGTPWGFSSGFILGITQMMFGLKNFSYVAGITAYLILALSDYLIAFGVLGFGGVFRKREENQTKALVLGTIFASTLRYICHFISGVVIWKDYAPANTIKAIVKYSAGYNASYMIPEVIVTVIGVVALSKVVDFTSENLKVVRKEKATE